jgi:hypothetical protein
MVVMDSKRMATANAYDNKNRDKNLFLRYRPANGSFQARYLESAPLDCDIMKI